MLRNAVTAILFSIPLVAGAALAQTSDFSILAGAYAPGFSVGGRPGTVSAFVGANVQLGYGHQLLRTRNGSFDLDVPLTVTVRSGEVVGRAVSVSTRSNAFFAPGVRSRVAPEARVSPFVVLGGGFGTFENAEVRAGLGVGITSERVVSPLLSFGCGADLRLTRLLSLRGQVRDFVGRAGLGGVEGRHHPVVSVGFGFHFR